MGTLHDSQQKQLAEGKLFEYASLDQAKQDIIQGVQALDTATDDQELAKKNADLLDKIYTILNKGNVLDRVQEVLPTVLRGEYSDKMVIQIAYELTTAPLTYAERSEFADNLAKDKVINPKVLLTPGSYTVDDLTFNSSVNKAMFDHLKIFGVGQQMKGPAGATVGNSIDSSIGYPVVGNQGGLEDLNLNDNSNNGANVVVNVAPNNVSSGSAAAAAAANSNNQRGNQ